MRVLVMSDLYPPYYIGGYELNCHSTVEVLLQRGHEVLVLTSRWGLSRDTVADDVYRVLAFAPSSSDSTGDDAHDLLRLRRRYRQVSRALALRKNYQKAWAVLRAVRPDIAFVWHMENVSYLPVLAAQDQGIPTVFRLEDYSLAQLKTHLELEASPITGWYRTNIIGLGGFERLNTSHMLPVSRAVMQGYISAGFPAQDMHVIPEGIRSDLLIEPDELPDLSEPGQGREVRLLFAGRLVSEKGPDVAIQALRHLCEDPASCRFKLDIVGDGSSEYKLQLRDMVARSGLEDCVTFAGRLDHDQLLALYSQYDALLVTSRWAEPFGITVLEAMARGLPVISSSCGGLAEIISDGDNGLLVPPDEPFMLANAVRRLVQEPGLAHAIRHAALKTIHEKYSLQRVVGQLEGYLEPLAGTRVLPGRNPDK